MRIGVQSYTFRKLGFQRAVEYCSLRGLKVLEAYPAHVPPNIEGARLAREVSDRVSVSSHGVNKMEGTGLSSLFSFAKEGGVEVLVADPSPESLPTVDQLAKEFDVRVAIHNHGPKHRWGSALSAGELLQSYDRRLGLCLDLGHLARSKEDPFKVLEKYGERLFDVHVKDLNSEEEDVPVGAGVLKVREFLRALRESGLDPLVMIEYEADPDDPIRGVDQSLAFVRASLE
ncbi:hypothetical protein HS1genome_1672 [Sulfodiicoccus acidiphilus]|uniref:Xylose isomerase-like TIM barrel domain-containing protein n=1 Tax=Sulfodiicoccus acidiphilus TaxID=1670455 RepID=A0A348B531_9CREN|nr:sugar phosphate isomerase/epimerase [Sulfodiicoccus acidiphilus]BBD73283.1 hypothetical protein HS1genome_1672 [Sulfodiicoccus acidiphilus]GGT89378.1 hypothetical protein GCM10007116_04030 [Sulfodiicoccus acidiphilus]